MLWCVVVCCGGVGWGVFGRGLLGRRLKGVQCRVCARTERNESSAPTEAGRARPGGGGRGEGDGRVR